MQSLKALVAVLEAVQVLNENRVDLSQASVDRRGWQAAWGERQVNSLAQYNSVKQLVRPGDVVMFWGRGSLSVAIELFGGGPSHSAIVRQGVTDQGEDATITQSTIRTWNGRRLDGVQTEPLGATIAQYSGAAAVLRLSDEVRSRIDWQKFYEVIGASDGFVGYDIAGLFEYLVRDIPILGAQVAQGEHKSRMVCSSWVTAVLESCGPLIGINWTQVTPQQLVEMGIYRDWLALLGKPRLRRFNTI